MAVVVLVVAAEPGGLAVAVFVTQQFQNLAGVAVAPMHALDEGRVNLGQVTCNGMAASTMLLGLMAKDAPRDVPSLGHREGAHHMGHDEVRVRVRVRR
mmetsp:Transcript_59344/g.106713  ORF Transcript_59344/g.106713 Transcript_59344/m.106713 type:complete len:98 (-) Transcript_59344:121-414(-)